jgi:hypothetical protein
VHALLPVEVVLLLLVLLLLLLLLPGWVSNEPLCRAPSNTEETAALTIWWCMLRLPAACICATASVVLLLLILSTLSQLHSRPNSCTASGLPASPAAAMDATKGLSLVTRMARSDYFHTSPYIAEIQISKVATSVLLEGADADADAAAAAAAAAGISRTQLCSSMQHWA